MTDTILIVDDEPDVSDLLVYNLQKAGYKTVTARDGNAALQKARDEVPSLIVLDLMLPQMEGTEVCRHLKADSKTTHIPIIMLTAKAEEVDRVVGLELGADDYVTKPFSPARWRCGSKACCVAPRGKTAPAEILKFGDLTIDIAKHEVTLKDKVVD